MAVDDEEYRRMQAEHEARWRADRSRWTGCIWFEIVLGCLMVLAVSWGGGFFPGIVLGLIGLCMSVMSLWRWTE